MPSINNIRINVKVHPNASRNEVAGLSNGTWRIKIAAPPDKGKANKELIDFLSHILDLRKDNIIILKGQTSHNKIICVSGMSEEEIIRRLEVTDKD